MSVGTSTSLAMASRVGTVNCGMGYLNAQPDPHIAWDNCQRGDWLGWTIDRLPGIDRRLIATAACKVARMALAMIPEVEDRPRWVIGVAESWVMGGATLADVRLASSVARTESNESIDQDIRAALWSAYLAAGTADGSTGLEPLCTYVASRVGEFGSTSASCADIVREVIPFEVIAPLVRRIGTDGVSERWHHQPEQR